MEVAAAIDTRAEAIIVLSPVIVVLRVIFVDPRPSGDPGFGSAAIHRLPKELRRSRGKRKDRTVSSRPTIRAGRGGSFLTRSVVVTPVTGAVRAERVTGATKQ